MLKKILSALGLTYQPDKVLHLPTKEKRTTKAVALPDDVVATKTGLVQVKTGADSIEWKQVSKETQTDKDPTVTDADLAGLIKLKLKPDLIKATKLKMLWAQGAVVSDVAASLASDGGFSHSTVEKHFRVFNKNSKQ